MPSQQSENIKFIFIENIYIAHFILYSGKYSEKLFRHTVLMKTLKKIYILYNVSVAERKNKLLEMLLSMAGHHQILNEHHQDVNRGVHLKR